MESGYQLIKNLIEKDEIFNIRSRMQDVFRNFNCHCDKDIMCLFKNDFDAFIGCANVCQKLPEIYKLAGSLNATLNHLGISFPALNTKPLVSFSSKNTAKNESYYKIGPHQDWASNLGSKNGLTCWIPLQDLDESLGPLELCPNSHNLGLLKHTNTTPPIIADLELASTLEYVPVLMNVGDALFFNTMLIHRSGNNITEDRIRWSIHFRYNDVNEKYFIERKYPKNITGD